MQLLFERYKLDIWARDWLVFRSVLVDGSLIFIFINISICISFLLHLSHNLVCELKYRFLLPLSFPCPRPCRKILRYRYSYTHLSYVSSYGSSVGHSYDSLWPVTTVKNGPTADRKYEKNGPKIFKHFAFLLHLWFPTEHSSISAQIELSKKGYWLIFKNWGGIEGEIGWN